MASFIAQLKTQLKPAEWPSVVAALRGDRALWTSLSETDFGAAALEACGKATEHWAPGFLGLLRIGQEKHFEALRASPLKAAPEKLRYQAGTFLEELQRADEDDEGSAPDLESSIWLALALRERYRITGSWDTLHEDLDWAQPSFWQLPLACLMGLLPEPEGLLRALLGPTTPDDLSHTALKALLSNPATDQGYFDGLVNALEEFGVDHWTRVLRPLAALRPTLSQILAEHALGQIPAANGKAESLEQLEASLAHAELLQLSGKHDQAMPLLNDVWEAAQRFQAGLAAKLAESAAKNEDGTIAAAALEQVAQLDPGKTGHTSSNGVAKGIKGPDALLSAARVALKNGETAEAHDMAHTALEAAQAGPPISNKVEFLNDLTQLFFDLDLPGEARDAASLASEQNPRNAHSAYLLSLAEQRAGEDAAALQAAHLAVALDPQRADLRKHLAGCLQAAQEYAEALVEWEHSLDGDAEPAREEMLALAECALLSGDAQRCALACRHVVVEHEDDAQAQQLLGRALLANGDAEGVAHLRKSVELDSSQVDSWLALANYEIGKGENQKAVDVLLRAVKALPHSAEIRTALASAQHSAGQAEDARASYRGAQQLAQGESQHNEVAQNIALGLGQVERELGLRREASKTLEAAYRSFPGSVEIAHQYGQVLIEIGQPEKALDVLAAARQLEPADLALQLDLARAHLAAGKNLGQAEALLKSALAEEAGNMEAHILLAETQLALGQAAEAGKSFDRLAKSMRGEDAKWGKRVQLGQAQVKMTQGHLAEAIAQLEELQKSQPQDLDVVQALCAAYRRAQRGEEAFQIAQQVYLSSTQDESTLLWYARQARAAGMQEEAIQALGRAAHKSAKGLLVPLAELEWEIGKSASARDTLARLLENEEADEGELLQAAQFLREHEAPKEAIRYIKKAIERSAEPQADLFHHLSRALAKSGQLDAALTAREKSINLAPKHPRYLVEKANLLQEMDRPQAALQTLDEALALLPEDASLLIGKTRLLAAAGDWAEAARSAEKAAGCAGNHFEIIQFAAELLAAHLQPGRARAVIAQSQLAETFELACLDAELALEMDEGVQAAKSAAPLLDAYAEHPRVLALQARLAMDRKDISAANGYLKKALREFGTLHEDERQAAGQRPTLLAIAQAAHDARDWDTALHFFKDVIASEPENARTQATYAEALIQRASWQRLCSDTHARAHMGEEEAGGKGAYRAAAAALKAAHKLAPFEDSRAYIDRQQARVALIFDPQNGLEALPEGYPESAVGAAALAYASRITGDRDRLKDLVKEYAKAPAVLAQYALAILETDPAEAVVAARLAAKLAPEIAPYHALLAITAKANSELGEALKAIEQALALWPGEARWHALAAQIQEGLDDLAGAAAHYEEAGAIEPHYAAHHFALGSVQTAGGRAAAAVEAFGKAVDLAPREGDYVLALARAHLQTGNLPEAEKSAKRVVKLDAQNVEGLLIQAEIALRSGAAARAQSLTESALKLKPKHLEALKLHAEAQFALGNFEAAITTVEDAQKIAEDKVPWQIRRAQLLPHSRGRGSDVEALKQLAERHPKRAEVWMALSQALALAGRLREAIDCAQKALRFAAGLPDEVRARALLHLGQLLRHDGQLDQSLHHLDEAAQLAGHLGEVHLERGQVFLARRQQAEALKAFEQAAESAPAAAEPHLQAGLALKDAKDYSAAEKRFRRAAELAPKNREIQRQLAGIIALNFVHKPEEAGAES